VEVKGCDDALVTTFYGIVKNQTELEALWE